MYFKQKEDTNIDEEFKERSRQIKSRKALKILFITIGALSILSVLVLLVFFAGNRLTLQGSRKMTIYQGTNYTDPGYSARDLLNNDHTSDVIVSGTVDSKIIGSYVVKYKYGLRTIKREVTVVAKPAIVTLILLSGNSTIFFNVGDTYIEPGYSAVDAIDGDLTDKVKINSNVNMNKEGTYQIIYSVINSDGVTTSETRNVIVK